MPFAVIIVACWADDAKLRPSLSEVTSGITSILVGKSREGHKINALITVTDKPSSPVTVTDHVGSAKSDVAVQFAPGQPWRRVEITKDEIVNDKVIGQVSMCTVCFSRDGAHLKPHTTCARVCSAI